MKDSTRNGVSRTKVLMCVFTLHFEFELVNMPEGEVKAIRRVTSATHAFWEKGQHAAISSSILKNRPPNALQNHKNHPKPPQTPRLPPSSPGYVPSPPAHPAARCAGRSPRRRAPPGSERPGSSANEAKPPRGSPPEKPGIFGSLNKISIGKDWGI